MRRTIATLAGVAAALIVGASPAAADSFWGVTGTYQANSAICRWDGIHVGMPIMYPSHSTGLVGGSQSVGFYAILERYNGSAWVDVATSKPYVTKVGWTYLEGLHWWDGTAWTIDGPTFSMAGRSGYFRHSYMLFWFDNGVVTGRVRALGWGLGDDRGVDERLWGYWDWCKY